MHNIKDVKERLSRAAHSAKGRNVLTFLVFLLISTGFWFIMALNDEVQHEFEAPLSINGIPADMTIMTSIPSHISVDIKDKSISLIRWDWGKVPQIDLDYSQFQNNGRALTMNSTQLTGIIRSTFGGNTNVVEVRPDSLYLLFTTIPAVRKKIHLLADVTTSPQYTVSGPFQLSSDSVNVYSLTNISRDLKIYTDSIDLTGLTDTTYVKVNLTGPTNVKIEPSMIEVMIPVEPLISKRVTVPVEVVDHPDNVKVITFPSTADVTYTLPISLYNRDDSKPRIIATYINGARKLALSLDNVPNIYNSPHLETDSVEYLVERR